MPRPFAKYGSRIESPNVQVEACNDVNGEESDRRNNTGRCLHVVKLVPPMDAGDDGDIPKCLRYMESEWQHGMLSTGGGDN
jgi:hypothetical protein